MLFNVTAIALAPTYAEENHTLSHLSLFPTLPILFDVLRCFPRVLSANAIQIATSLSIFVPLTTSSRNAIFLYVPIPYLMRNWLSLIANVSPVITSRSVMSIGLAYLSLRYLIWYPSGNTFLSFTMLASRISNGSRAIASLKMLNVRFAPFEMNHAPLVPGSHQLYPMSCPLLTMSPGFTMVELRY